MSAQDRRFGQCVQKKVCKKVSRFRASSPGRCDRFFAATTVHKKTTPDTNTNNNTANNTNTTKNENAVLYACDRCHGRAFPSCVLARRAAASKHSK